MWVGGSVWVGACVSVGLFSYQTSLPGFSGFNLADHTLALTKSYQLKLDGAGAASFCCIRHCCRKWAGQSHPRP